MAKLRKDRRLFYHYILKDLPVNYTEYDLAVAYAGPMDLISYYIVHKVKAQKKVQWIHFDIDHIGFDSYFAQKLYGQFQQIFTVSEEGRHKLLQRVPALEERTDVFPNLLSPTLIMAQAAEGEGFQDHFTGMRLLTVGRLSHEKGQDLAIEALSFLVRNGFDVRWYFVGTGSEADKYKQLAAEKGVSDYAVFLGEQLNPYPYMKECDVYVQPSRHEGYCITLAEAKLFHKPIVTTDFTGAREQTKAQQTGIIVEVDAWQIYQAVRNLLNTAALRHNLSDNLTGEQQSWSVEKLYSGVR
nr:glycosyltransferase [Lentibacillus sp. JNUCC-1]